MDILTLANKVKTVSPEELRVAVPMMVIELDELYNNVLDLLDNISSIKAIIEEVVDDDRDYKRGELE